MEPDVVTFKAPGTEVRTSNKEEPSAGFVIIINIASLARLLNVSSSRRR